MEHIEFLKEVAQELGQQNILNSLNAIQERASQQNANLLIPLVGEFSSGKTTLLNALTDSKKLETATKPTTATIYEIHFGCNKCEANVVLSDGQVAHFDDLGELKNDQLSDAQIVTVFDTSTKVPYHQPFWWILRDCLLLLLNIVRCWLIFCRLPMPFCW